ncbi:hypothetical protein DDZ14_05230 [Maritimibacter sp. 55A14]|uniref:LPS export ABC transporter periplasmic protein LptC n=1 Tax=Maritimibacter sp. 55A14 TaxID=2174844 RepID=UPI000D610E3B|nr:LPS export ABC transporter periplasmic protein LptC [Maritimibacter sp. 55A14]PWE33592.1 hypothetical protein DDZ14_05230 [Maritimibacter sp. 55A14]
MARADNAYSRFIAWVKVALPILALALLSTLFLFSRPDRDGLEIPYSDVEIAEKSRGEQVGAPDYAGVTTDGSAIRVTADALSPDPANPSMLQAERLTAQLTTPGGAVVDVTAREGTLDLDTRLVRLSGEVDLVSSAGYDAQTDVIFAYLDETRLESAGKVRASGPPGRITAGQMQLTRRPGEPARYVLVFKNGVNLIYEP